MSRIYYTDSSARILTWNYHPITSWSSWDLSYGLIGRWTFENTLTDTYNGYNLQSVVGATDYDSGMGGFSRYGTPWSFTPDGKVGYGLLNGTGTRGSIGNKNISKICTLPSGRKKMSISVWTKITDSSADIQCLWSWYGVPNEDYYGDVRFGRLVCITEGYSYHNLDISIGAIKVVQSLSTYRNDEVYIELISNKDYRDNLWHHYVFTSDGGRNYFYIDGILVKDFLRYDIVPELPITHFFLNNAGGISWNVAGISDFLYLYDVCLTAGQVTELYNNGNGI